MIVVVLAGCAATVHPIHNVTCGGMQLDIPPSLHVVRVNDHTLIAASPDVAVAVFEDGPTRTGRANRVIEQISDLDRPVFRIAFGEANRCAFRAVALLPASADGRAVLEAVGGSTEPSLIVGSPRVPRESALTVLLRESRNHFHPSN